MIQRAYIGKGRSAQVYRTQGNGQDTATKVFTGEKLSKIVLFLCTGSANPYTWSEDAIACAFIRRKILEKLCRYWFGEKLTVPKTFGYRWNPGARAFELEAEYIDGCHAPLINPVDGFVEHAALRQHREVMQPLQRHLIDSGFDGLVWQAGKGNPVALSNFKCHQTDGRVARWVWIDMESGVPALFALNPLSTLLFYLPKCVKHRGALFDDVDIRALKEYVRVHAAELAASLGEAEVASLNDEIQQLQTHQHQWKSIPRYRRSLLYAHSQQKISDEQKEAYFDRPIAWYARATASLLKSVPMRLLATLLMVIRIAVALPLVRLARASMRYCSSSDYRWRFVRLFLRKQVTKWHGRGCLSGDARRALLRELAENQSSACLTDFSMHLALKPFVKSVSWGIVPLLTVSGVISLATGGLIFLVLGAVARTLYTSMRIIQGVASSSHYCPFCALVVGMLPVVGNLAYPIELLARSSPGNNAFERFIVFALVTKIGAKVPIWGGQDSGVEHFFNRWCYWVFQLAVFFPTRQPVAAPRDPALRRRYDQSHGAVASPHLARQSTPDMEDSASSNACVPSRPCPNAETDM